ncbi:hypothetical protein FB562_2183 [Homoserinimonas aerilata]|uniref:Uncharacterized protein n=1 Tax=Homoserinimonas aerilata TaxID=1162970 RepID=A0A542YEZ5_9MICO|nr:hypothetical protein [Homoserinimonas aerilata]TQL46659.1 hypothetical protein FB562_2183 [Homoserinimonas aerilata]
MTLTAIISPIRDGRATGRAETAEISADGADYGAAKVALQGLVPQGWRMLAIRYD